MDLDRLYENGGTVVEVRGSEVKKSEIPNFRVYGLIDADIRVRDVPVKVSRVSRGFGEPDFEVYVGDKRVCQLTGFENFASDVLLAASLYLDSKN